MPGKPAQDEVAAAPTVRDNHRQFQVVLDNLQAGAYLCDRAGLITYFNQQAAQLWGRAPELGDPINRFCGSLKLFALDGSPIARDKCLMALALETGQAQTAQEVVIEQPSGVRRFLLAHANLIRDEAGGLVGAVGTLVDITERKRTETGLRQSEEELRSLIDAEPACIKLVAADGALLQMNTAGLAMIEAPHWEVVQGRCVFDLIVPEHRAAYRDFHRRVCSGGRGKLEFDIIGLQGNRRSMLAHAVPFHLRPTGVAQLSVTYDITERKQAERDLRASEERYRKVVEGSLQGILIHQDERICYANHALSKMFGYNSPEELIGQPLWETFVVSENMTMLQERTRAILDGHEPPPHPGWRAIGKDGREIWVATAAGRIELHGRPAVVSFYLDVSERRRLEAQVLHAQKLESLGILAGGVAHDFNNLLTVMLGYASLARMTLAHDASAIAMLEGIEKAGQRAAELAQQMLAYSGKGKFLVEVVPLDGVVQEMARLLDTVVSKKASLRLDLQPACLEGDPTQIRQVIMNLITNAADSLGSDPGVVAIRTGVQIMDAAGLRSPFVPEALPAGAYAFIDVQDTGCGMTLETLGKIFDPFFTTKFTGRGLGLAAALGIVRSHRGTIKVSSAVGQGTTFALFFPSVAPIPVTLPVAGAGERPLPAAGAILVIEDEENVRTLTRQVLEREGYKVLTAADGCEGLAAFVHHQQEIVAVVLDMTMPRKDGIEVLRELRALTSQTPVLLMSGYAEVEAMGQTAGLDVAGFLQKPFHPLALIDKVRRMLR